jgi:hypothetical protein
VRNAPPPEQAPFPAHRVMAREQEPFTLAADRSRRAKVQLVHE